MQNIQVILLTVPLIIFVMDVCLIYLFNKYLEIKKYAHESIFSNSDF